MSSIKKRSDRTGKVVWRAYHRDPSGWQHNKSFARRVDAERYLATIESARLLGSYVDPGAGRITVEAWSQRWIATQGHLQPSTHARYEGVLSKQIVPRWGTVPLSAITHSAVAAWIADLGLAPATVRYIHRVFSLMLDMAVRDSVLARNPAAGVRLPKLSKAERRFLTATEVDALADAIVSTGSSCSRWLTAVCGGASWPRFGSAESTLCGGGSRSSSRSSRFAGT
jgi:hypothetical protein